MEDLKTNSTEAIIADPAKKFEEAEWVFQFDDEEPLVFAWSDSSGDPGDVTITLKPNEKSRITFTNINGTKILSLYSRPITEETRIMRDQRVIK